MSAAVSSAHAFETADPAPALPAGLAPPPAPPPPPAGADVPPQAAISTPRITATTMVAPDVRATDPVLVGRSTVIVLSPSANCRMPMTADPRSPAGPVKSPSRFVRARASADDDRDAERDPELGAGARGTDRAPDGAQGGRAGRERRVDPLRAPDHEDARDPPHDPLVGDHDRPVHRRAQVDEELLADRQVQGHACLLYTSD